MKQTILTGIRPTGKLHLGHYFGATRNWVSLQNDYRTFIEIADVQALTDNFHHPEKVRENVREITLDLLAAGIDPNKATIFIQSMIPEIAELTVFYSNLVTIARLHRNPTVKTEVKQKKELFGNQGESITYGFLGYPVSQAADITAFHGELIPVGEDQLPLIEQCREIVRKFNSIYGESLIEPEPLLSENARIKGLDGNEKMGKSLGNAIYLADSEEEVSKKIMAAVTDPNKIKKDDPANPEVCMVYYYHKLVSQTNLNTICSECKKGSRGCVACKKELVQNMMEFLKPIQEKRHYYEERPELVDKILKDGTEVARKEARNTMRAVREKMQIDYFEEK
ncbi:MAG TPA: tryptophan--tRNA ligase [Candidatus Fimihabitans intestinipullorum]|uniref:Tryptophan--tRNA ligase n=1 Tax=Candidatus Fimihabitans intestinipullorum TaxID=2840820 RepID=A0A9D1HUC4_9BACT|nr:tryptophan--tRNA ligase [Candidatus Fimihabitans intestinipullorum]